MLDRRGFIASVTASILIPSVVGAQPGRLPLIAILQPTSPAAPLGGIVHFKEGLAQLGWIEGRTVRFETRYGDWQPDRIIEAARELVSLQPDVLFTNYAPAVRAAMQATKTIPIVAVSDLLAIGAVKTLAYPGGNITGVTPAQHELDRKRLEILKEAVRSVTRVAYLFDPEPAPESALPALDESARVLSVRILRAGVRSPSELESAFAAMVKDAAQAVLVQDSTLLARYVNRVTALALNHRLPTISQSPQFAELGGFLQYGADVWELFRRSATHVDKILRGAKAGELPVEQPTKISLTINLKTAKALGLTIPPSLLARADQVIQ